MQVNHRRMNRVDLIAVSGRIDAASAPQLKQQIDSVFEEGRYRVVLDLSDLEYISSREWKFTDIEGGDIRIVHMPPRVKEVFDLTGFTALFDIYDDTVEAVGSF